MTMLLMFVPLHALYEISVLIAWIWERQSTRKEALEGRI
jgi:Sec-independent protein secretion pathway component TatC